jgi:hypothetical protein
MRCRGAGVDTRWAAVAGGAAAGKWPLILVAVRSLKGSPVASHHFLARSQSFNGLAGLRLAGRDLGVDALASRVSAIGTQAATASSLPLRRGCATHPDNRATVGP